MGVSFAANSSDTVPEAAKATSAARKAALWPLHMWFPQLSVIQDYGTNGPILNRLLHGANNMWRGRQNALQIGHRLTRQGHVSPNGTISFETSLLRDPGKISASGASPIPKSSRNAAASSSVAIGSVTTGCPTKSQDMPARCIKGGSNGKSAKT